MSYWTQRKSDECGTGVEIPISEQHPGLFMGKSGTHRSVPEIDPSRNLWSARAIYVFPGLGMHESGYMNLTLVFFDYQGNCLGKASGIDVVRFDGPVVMDGCFDEGAARYFPPGDEINAFFRIERGGTSTITACVEGLNHKEGGR